MNCLIVLPDDKTSGNKTFKHLIEDFYKPVIVDLNIEPIELQMNKSFDYSKIEFKGRMKNYDLIIFDISNSDPMVMYFLGFSNPLISNNVLTTCADKSYELPEIFKSFYKVHFYNREKVLNGTDRNKSFYKTRLKEKMNAILMEGNQNPFACVENFYRELSKKNFDNAWKYLSQDFKSHRWFDLSQLFEVGYQHLNNLDYININELSRTENSATYLVTLSEFASSPTLVDSQVIGKKVFSNHNSRRLAEYREIVKDVNILKRELKKFKLNTKVLDDLTFSQFFSPSFSKDLKWLLIRDAYKQNNPTLAGDISELFPSSGSSRVFYALKVKVGLNKNNWFIQQIIDWARND